MDRSSQDHHDCGDDVDDIWAVQSDLQDIVSHGYQDTYGKSKYDHETSPPTLHDSKVEGITSPKYIDPSELHHDPDRIYRCIRMNDLEQLEDILYSLQSQQYHPHTASDGDARDLFDINKCYVDNLDINPFMFAVQMDNREAMRLLFKYGADPNVKSEKLSYDALLIAFSANNFELFRDLVENYGVHFFCNHYDRQGRHLITALIALCTLDVSIDHCADPVDSMDPCLPKAPPPYPSHHGHPQIDHSTPPRALYPPIPPTTTTATTHTPHDSLIDSLHTARIDHRFLPYVLSHLGLNSYKDVSVGDKDGPSPTSPSHTSPSLALPTSTQQYHRIDPSSPDTLVNYPDQHGDNALLLAVKMHNYHIIPALLQLGCNVCYYHPHISSSSVLQFIAHSQSHYAIKMASHQLANIITQLESNPLKAKHGSTHHLFHHSLFTCLDSDGNTLFFTLFNKYYHLLTIYLSMPDCLSEPDTDLCLFITQIGKLSSYCPIEEWSFYPVIAERPAWMANPTDPILPSTAHNAKDITPMNSTTHDAVSASNPSPEDQTSQIDKIHQYYVTTVRDTPSSSSSSSSKAKGNHQKGSKLRYHGYNSAIDLCNATGNNPLTVSISLNNIHLVQYLLRLGSTPFLTYYQYSTIIEQVFTLHYHQLAIYLLTHELFPKLRLHEHLHFLQTVHEMSGSGLIMLCFKYLHLHRLRWDWDQYTSSHHPAPLQSAPSPPVPSPGSFPNTQHGMHYYTPGQPEGESYLQDPSLFPPDDRDHLLNLQWRQITLSTQQHSAHLGLPHHNLVYPWRSPAASIPAMHPHDSIVTTTQAAIHPTGMAYAHPQLDINEISAIMLLRAIALFMSGIHTDDQRRAVPSLPSSINASSDDMSSTIYHNILLTNAVGIDVLSFALADLYTTPEMVSYILHQLYIAPSDSDGRIDQSTQQPGPDDTVNAHDDHIHVSPRCEDGDQRDRSEELPDFVMIHDDRGDNGDHGDHGDHGDGDNSTDRVHHQHRPSIPLTSINWDQICFILINNSLSYDHLLRLTRQIISRVRSLFGLPTTPAHITTHSGCHSPSQHLLQTIRQHNDPRLYHLKCSVVDPYTRTTLLTRLIQDDSKYYSMCCEITRIAQVGEGGYLDPPPFTSLPPLTHQHPVASSTCYTNEYTLSHPLSHIARYGPLLRTQTDQTPTSSQHTSHFPQPLAMDPTTGNNPPTHTRLPIPNTFHPLSNATHTYSMDTPHRYFYDTLTTSLTLSSIASRVVLVHMLIQLIPEAIFPLHHDVLGHIPFDYLSPPQEGSLQLMHQSPILSQSSPASIASPLSSASSISPSSSSTTTTGGDDKDTILTNAFSYTSSPSLYNLVIEFYRSIQHLPFLCNQFGVSLFHRTQYFGSPSQIHFIRSLVKSNDVPFDSETASLIPKLIQESNEPQSTQRDTANKDSGQSRWFSWLFSGSSLSCTDPATSSTSTSTSTTPSLSSPTVTNDHQKQQYTSINLINMMDNNSAQFLPLLYSTIAKHCSQHPTCISSFIDPYNALYKYSVAWREMAHDTAMMTWDQSKDSLINPKTCDLSKSIHVILPDGPASSLNNLAILKCINAIPYFRITSKRTQEPPHTQHPAQSTVVAHYTNTSAKHDTPLGSQVFPHTHHLSPSYINTLPELTQDTLKVFVSRGYIIPLDYIDFFPFPIYRLPNETILNSSFIFSIFHHSSGNYTQFIRFLQHTFYYTHRHTLNLPPKWLEQGVNLLLLPSSPFFTDDPPHLNSADSLLPSQDIIHFLSKVDDDVPTVIDPNPHHNNNHPATTSSIFEKHIAVSTGANGRLPAYFTNQIAIQYRGYRHIAPPLVAIRNVIRDRARRPDGHPSKRNLADLIPPHVVTSVMSYYWDIQRVLITMKPEIFIYLFNYEVFIPLLFYNSIDGLQTPMLPNFGSTKYPAPVDILMEYADKPVPPSFCLLPTYERMLLNSSKRSPLYNPGQLQQQQRQQRQQQNVLPASTARTNPAQSRLLSSSSTAAAGVTGATADLGPLFSSQFDTQRYDQDITLIMVDLVLFELVLVTYSGMANAMTMLNTDLSRLSWVAKHDTAPTPSMPHHTNTNGDAGKNDYTSTSNSQPPSPQLSFSFLSSVIQSPNCTSAHLYIINHYFPGAFFVRNPLTNDTLFHVFCRSMRLQRNIITDFRIFAFLYDTIYEYTNALNYYHEFPLCIVLSHPMVDSYLPFVLVLLQCGCPTPKDFASQVEMYGTFPSDVNGQSTTKVSFSSCMDRLPDETDAHWIAAVEFNAPH